MRMERCPDCKDEFGHHGGPFIQCPHCGYVLSSPLKARPPSRPATAYDRHSREENQRTRFDRDYSGDPQELRFD